MPEFRTTVAGDRPRRDRPDLSVEYRRGVSPTWDVGGRLYGAGVSVDARHLAVRGDAVEATVGVGARGGLPTDVSDYGSLASYEIALEPAARVGINVSRKSQLAVGVTTGLVYVSDSVGSSSGKLVKRGVSFVPELTFAFDIGISDGFHVVPQIGAASFVGSDSFVISDDTIRLRAALGFYF